MLFCDEERERHGIIGITNTQPQRHHLMICHECFEKKYMIKPLREHNDCALCPNLENENVHNYPFGNYNMKTCLSCASSIKSNAKEILKKTALDALNKYGDNLDTKKLLDIMNIKKD
jgi:hypothetical protein